MSYDPIQRAIDRQLASNTGKVTDVLIYEEHSLPDVWPLKYQKNRLTKTYNHGPEDSFVYAFDRKYHFNEVRVGRIMDDCEEGYTQKEIATRQGITQARVSQIIKGIKY